MRRYRCAQTTLPLTRSLVVLSRVVRMVIVLSSSVVEWKSTGPSYFCTAFVPRPVVVIQQQQHNNNNNNNGSFARHRRRPQQFMFTGIVEEIGTVVELNQRSDMVQWDGSTGSGTELAVQGNVVLDDAYLGCSICVSGVCLTATALDFETKIFKVGLAPETLRRTYFGSLKVGDSVNLERASEIGGRNSGHFVQGHVDGMGDIVDRWQDGDSLFYKIQASSDILKYIVPKGFVAIDGTSLTVVDVNMQEKWFTFMLVAFTQQKIIVPSKQIGCQVNIEVDVLGKYSAALLPRLEALEAKVEFLEQELAKKVVS